MSQKVEGTIVLDGLIEGRFSDGEESKEKLQGWATFMQSALGLRFSLDTQGDAFNLLPDNEPTATQPMGHDPQDALKQAIEQLIEALPQSDRPSVFSTLRSSEIRKNEEVQTVYGVGRDGQVSMESRTVDAKTVAGEIPLTTRQKVIFGATGLGIAAVIIALVFLLFPGLREKVGDTIKSVDAAEVQVDITTFKSYFTVEIKDISRTRAILTVTPTDAYPLDAAALDVAYANAMTLSERLTIEALARGYVSVEYYSDENVLFNWESSPLPRMIAAAIKRAALQAKQDAAKAKANPDAAATTAADTKPKPTTLEFPLAISKDGRHRIARIVISY